jgi:hypothetical protein
MMKNKLILGLLLSIMLITIVSASIPTLGTFKQNSCIELKNTCASCSYINFTRVSYPNSTRALDNVQATKDGSNFNYTFCGTSALGIYIVDGIGDVDGTDTVFAYDFVVTPSGFNIGSEGSTVLIGVFAIMLIFSIGFFIVGNKTDSIAVKITMYSLAGIGFLMTVLYSVVGIQQVFYGVDAITSGVETFLFVIKTLVGIGALALGVVVFLIMLKAWKIRRGYDD